MFVLAGACITFMISFSASLLHFPLSGQWPPNINFTISLMLNKPHNIWSIPMWVNIWQLDIPVLPTLNICTALNIYKYQNDVLYSFPHVYVIIGWFCVLEIVMCKEKIQLTVVHPTYWRYVCHQWHSSKVTNYYLIYYVLRSNNTYM